MDEQRVIEVNLIATDMDVALSRIRQADVRRTELLARVKRWETRRVKALQQYTAARDKLVAIAIGVATVVGSGEKTDG